MRKLAIAAAALAFTGTAYAADMPLKAPPPPPAPTWTGLYIGINGGGVWGKTDTGVTMVNCPFIAPNECVQDVALGSNAISNSGWLAGGQIGYLLQAGSVIGGLEASFDWFKATGSALNSAPVGGVFAGSNNWAENASADWLALFLARVGVDMGAWFPYVTAGLAVANLKYSVAFLDTNSNTGTVASFSQVKVGPAAGLGVEWRWDSHWSLRGEYLYMVFNEVGGNTPVISFTTGLPLGPVAARASVNHKATFSENIARAALSYKF